MATLDKTFRPYYEFADTCKSAYDKYEKAYQDTDQSIREMYKFMTEDASNKTV